MRESSHGGQSASVQSDHELQLWVKRCHALGDVVEFRSRIDSAEICRRIKALGLVLGTQLVCYGRWIATFIKILFQKEVITAGEFAANPYQVRASELFESAEAQQGQRRL
ncbi:hypothetical protein [Pseudomonas abietaniphila]|uniref:hypothetical protein n=1 Tax=Pseudomonas abietaniphila TaxID=89065 RepID=UPI0009F51056|nr:hypothetical protein [Pseudomonas abietaniphila]